MLANVQGGGGVFQFSGGRMTSRRQCPRGVPVNVKEWGCFSIFRRADDVTQTMSKGGGGVLVVECLECLEPKRSHTPMVILSGFLGLAMLESR